MKEHKRIGIVGAGGFGKETLFCLVDSMSTTPIDFFVGDDYLKNKSLMGRRILAQSKFNPSLYDVVVAIGDPVLRKKVVESLPLETTYTNVIHSNVRISDWVKLGDGAIIIAGVVVTVDIEIGKHTHLNKNTVVGHDCVIGDYFTTAPGVSISGNVKIGDCVYFGSNSCVKQGISICDNVTIGMGGVVVKDIVEEGVYVGNPVRKLNKGRA